MSTPAGFPCLVMTISSDSARRRNRERSSFTSASATWRIGRAVRREPPLRFGLGDDRNDFDRFGCDVIENSHLPNPKAILRLPKTSQSLDPALAHAGRLVPQVPFESVSYLSAAVG